TTKQLAAFGDLAYNIGVPRFCHSTIARRFNAGDTAGACAAIKWYVYAGGKRLPGLVKRREAEFKLCMGQ
ncbi:MAG: glycoside hydrolase family protein, partial [Bradyrhizobium sp.]|nr:glycoside hydrolase family protein [Bradyrhizobium sp.]